jgi:hypothetical protein
MAPNLNAQLHSLLNTTGFLPQKRSLVFGFTNGRSESSKDMNDTEAIDLINYLKQHDKQGEAAEKMRRKIIHHAKEMGWLLPGNKANMQRINEWCEKYGYLHKPLNKYSYEELPKLVSQFANGVYKYYINNL